MDGIYRREHYLAQLRPFYDAGDLIKVITGVRRCGKSCLMRSVIDELRSKGVPDERITYLNLDQRGYRGVTMPDQLEAAILDKLPTDGGKSYLFVDEVQNVRGFETVINGFREDGGCSIFITGSNSYLLSGELATKLTGRYVEVEMFTLSFAEYMGMRSYFGVPSESETALFHKYLSEGGFPRSVEIAEGPAREAYISGVVSQIFDKDIRARCQVRDRALFDRVQAYVINNFAAPTNLSNVATYLRNSEGIAVKRETLSRYVGLLESAKVLYRCPRFDLKSRKMLRGGDKFYLADLGIYSARNTNASVSYGPALENLLYTYLRSHGYAVSVGKIGRLECDFIVRRDGRYGYVQVSRTIADPAVEEREYRPFRYIRDNYPRYLFTLDPLPEQKLGVRHLNLMEFLAEDRELELG